MKKTILMIHGMWGGNWCWDNYGDFFREKGYECIIPTLPYHGPRNGKKPDPRLGKMSVLDYVEFLEEKIRNFDKPPILMGHSMGGLLAQILATRTNPGALVLLGSAAPWGIPALDITVLKGFAGVIMRGNAFLNRATHLKFEEAVYGIYHLVPEEEQRENFNKLGYESGRATREIGLWFPLDMFKKATYVDEKKIKCPILILVGKEDRLTPVSTAKKIAKKFKVMPNILPGHAHCLPGEKGWEKIAGSIHTWLNEVLEEHSIEQKDKKV